MSAKTVICPAPPGEKLSADYSVRVNGAEAPVYAARVSAQPFNQVWPGYQRPMEQTEGASFACWDCDGPVDVEVSCARPFERVTVRPASRGIVPEVAGRAIRFELPGPGFVTVEVDGYHRALHLFASPPEERRPEAGDAGVTFFGPGVHRPGRMRLGPGEVLYVSGGAVVYGTVEARGAPGAKVLGRGILDGSGEPRVHERYQDQADYEPYGTVALYECEGAEVGGIITRDPNVYNVTAVACTGVHVHDVKTIGSWRYNSDGIDFLNSSASLVERCFVRSFDDSLVVTGVPRHRGCECGHLPANDITFRRCVVWNDWGRALEIGAACSAPEIADVLFEDIDVIHVAHVALDVQNTGRALVRGIRFENVRVEMDDGAPGPLLQRTPGETYSDPSGGEHCPRLCVAEVAQGFWTRDAEPGRVWDVTFRNVSAVATRFPKSLLRGHDPGHTVEGVLFENVTVNGSPLADAESARCSIGGNVTGVEFRT